MARIIDVIEAPDVAGDEIMRRLPENGPGDFRLGSQVIVRESQIAVFFRDGKALDVLGPGRHTITTANLPIISGMIGWVTGGKNPFPAEVVFLNMRQFIDQKWGTPQPLVFRDPELGMARLRARGNYAFQVAEPTMVVNNLVGQQGFFGTRQVADYLRGIIVQRFVDLLGEQKTSILDLAALYNELSAGVRVSLVDDFAALGLRLTAFYLEAVTPTEETEKAIDERAAMGAIGNMDAYMKFKAARAMGDAANNPGGGGTGEGLGMGAGLGMGVGMAQMMGQAFQQPQQPAPQQPAPAPAVPAPAAAASGPLTIDQVKAAMDNLDMRFSMGEMSEENYNRLMQKWQDKLQELGG
ncbi:MAG: SPFH domain-containing protein [Chloroflexaceae bacterium]|nr:SPFH domain-containing protein [Chloroflexaceae bacterium]